MESLKERIIHCIVEEKQVDLAALKSLSDENVKFRDFKKKLIEKELITEEEFILILSRVYQMPYLDLDKLRLLPENRELLSRDLAFRYKVLPISQVGDVLTLVTANPLDVVTRDDLLITTRYKKIDSILGHEDKIAACLEKLYSETEQEFTFEDDQEKDIQEVVTTEGEGLESIVKESRLPPIIRVVDLIVYEGLKRRASDIHVEPGENELTVRYRIDGVLHHGLTLPKKNQYAVLARLKIMSSLNITEFRIPQDGRFKVKYENRMIDFRVSTLPTHFGEKIVLRILDSSSLSVGVTKLGFSENSLKLFEEAIHAPFGIVLVTGPTGSGKSTTLYSVLSQLNTPERNVITIEDPVEYQLDGITQIQVRPEVGLSFASSLRCVLRQTPDVVMVGEIRDFETADIAIKASLTGQFIFSTLHTNNSVGAVTRLMDMGVEPFLLASSLVASTAQRLVRTLCPKCKEKEILVPGLLEKMKFPVSDEKEFFSPKGCGGCNTTGYRGRVALLEVLLLDDMIREMIVKCESEEKITEYAHAYRNFRSLKEDGFLKCVDGITSLEEVLRVAG